MSGQPGVMNRMLPLANEYIRSKKNDESAEKIGSSCYIIILLVDTCRSFDI